MTASTSKFAYPDCYDYFEQALEDGLGIGIPRGSRSEARKLIERLHMARRLERQDNAMIYEPGNPMYNRSVFDQLVVRGPEERDGRWFVRIEKRLVTNGIERLSQRTCQCGKEMEFYTGDGLTGWICPECNHVEML